jgi:hypothetical protein
MINEELVAVLQKLPPSSEVLLSLSPEGDEFVFLEDVGWSSLNYEGNPCHPDDADEARPKCVVLWPS